MRICLINSFMWMTSGAAGVCNQLIKQLAVTGRDEISLVCEKISPDLRLELESLNVEVFEIGLSGIGSGNKLLGAAGWLRIQALAVKAAKVLSRIEPDIVNPHNMIDVFYASRYKGDNQPDAKILWYCHEPWRPFYDRQSQMLEPLSERLFVALCRHIYSPLDMKCVRLFVDTIACNSMYTRQLVSKLYSRHAEVLYPGVDTGRFVPTSSSIKDDLNCKSLVLSVGLVDFPKKNCNVIPSVLSAIHNRRDLKWIHIGTGPDMENLIRLARINGVSESLRIVNYATEDELVKYYSSADLVVYTPLREPFGLIPLEAMACEKPVVASKCGGPLETVIDGRTGLLVDMSSPTDISHAISYMLDNKDSAKEMGALGRKRVCGKFSIEKMVADYRSLVQCAARGGVGEK